MFYLFLPLLFYFFAAAAADTEPTETVWAEGLLESLNKEIQNKEEQQKNYFLKRLYGISTDSSPSELHKLITHRKLLAYLLQENKLNLLRSPEIQDLTAITMIFDCVDQFKYATHPTLGPLAHYLAEKSKKHPNISTTTYLHFHLYGQKEEFAKAVLNTLNTIQPLPAELATLKEGLEAQFSAPK